MSVTWQHWSSFWKNSRNLKMGWLVAAAITALYVGVVRPHELQYGINNSKGTGLAEFRTEPIGLWKANGLSGYHAGWDRSPTSGVVGGVPGAVPHRIATQQMEVMNASLAPPPAPSAENRKMVRTASLDLVVKDPGEIAEKIRALSESMGGFLVSSEIRGEQEFGGGSVTIRIPAARFEEARAQIRRLGLRVENEKIEAEDVTRQYVDQAAGLRNL
ncbi:MAG TPA: DUF4349 domain-containing protein, partial [Candidatus Binatia bacterium]|nr:DUF4349 domain-containing protein [Candidatus Binatia bacterium]